MRSDKERDEKGKREGGMRTEKRPKTRFEAQQSITRSCDRD